jgi:Alcohol dehydrogenase GroES-like domain
MMSQGSDLSRRDNLPQLEAAMAFYDDFYGCCRDASEAQRAKEQAMTNSPRGTMRTAFYDRMGPARAVLTVAGELKPEPGHDGVLIKIEASGVTPHDTKHRSGWLSSTMYATRVVPHGEATGLVAGVGPRVHSMSEGDRMFVYRAGLARPGEGTAVQYVVMPHLRIHRRGTA